RRDGVGEKRHRGVALCERLAHDSRSDDRGKEQGGAEPFRKRSAQERHLRPISSSDFLSECASSLATGSSSSSRMREESVVKAPRNARRLSSSLPATAAGSGTPQWALTGCPGQSGHASPAALSHTVNTKSSAGASGPANSSQLFERSPSVLIPLFCSSSTAKGFTLPAGWLPAL